MRRACIDIGSNTTRLLVADCEPSGLVAVHQERAFTFAGRGLRDGEIAAAKIAEVTGVVSRQLEVARGLECAEVVGVATAAIRHARNGGALAAAIRESCGLEVSVLSGEQEARLAFVGAAGTLGHRAAGELGVVDVGGGSSELVLGTAPDHVSWWTSLRIGSGDLANECLHSDPPSAAELSQARSIVSGALEGLHVRRPEEAVAVGGSAASLMRFAGPRLDADAFRRSLTLLASEQAATIARRFTLEIDRVRLLPAGLLILQGASELFGAALQLGCGGLREGVLLEAGRV